MPINCKDVSIEYVIQFFEDDIDGMGKHDGHPRNEGVPDSLRQSQSWEFCELMENEFMRLEIPDGTGTLIKNKDEASLEGLTKTNAEELVEILNSGKSLPPLIVRTRLQGDSEDSSFYIEDGAKRAIALKIYFEKNPYKPVKTYIGTRKV